MTESTDVQSVTLFQSVFIPPSSSTALCLSSPFVTYFPPDISFHGLWSISHTTHTHSFDVRSPLFIPAKWLPRRHYVTASRGEDGSEISAPSDGAPVRDVSPLPPFPSILPYTVLTPCTHRTGEREREREREREKVKKNRTRMYHYQFFIEFARRKLSVRYTL